MAIYPDKKNGQLTGRFRVELQRGKERYRQRHDTFDAAQVDEARVKALWGQGAAPLVAQAAQVTSGPTTLAEGIAEATGKLWSGKSTETTCWQRMEHVKRILGPKTALDAIDTLQVDKLIQELRKAKKAPGTINRYLSHLRTFLVWCRRRKLRTADLEDGMFSWQDEPEGRIRWVTEDEEKATYEFLEGRSLEEAQAVRELIEVAIETGCRRDELLTAELGQINGTRLHLWETKTDTPRTVPMTQRTTELLTALIKDKRMPTRRNLRSWWDRVREHLGLAEDKDFVFHACRHTRATRMVDAGINVFVIKEWMGHKRLETTLRYAHVRPQNLEEALVKVGEYMAACAGKPQKPSDPTVPHSLPRGGGNHEMSMAA